MSQAVQSSEDSIGQAGDLVEAVSTALGVRIPADLARLAVTHRSYAYERGGLPTNERLEFLGDTVLGLAITDRLYREHPEENEGRLATWRSAVVSTKALAVAARDLGIGPFLLLGRGENATGGRDKDSILADTMEALFGAVYLEHGASAAIECVQRVLGRYVDRVVTAGFTGDWKTTLMEHSATQGQQLVYQSSSVGPDHDKVFTVVVTVDGAEAGVGTGRSKKAAEQEAAAAACRSMGLAGDSA